MSTEWYGKNIDIFIMHILIVTQYFWPENFRINDLTSELVNRGHKVTILTGQPNYPEGFVYLDYLKNESNYNYYKGAKVIRVPIITRGKSKIKLLLNYISFALSASTIGIYRLKNINVHVYERSRGGFQRISCFNVDGARTTVHVLYGGRVHYDALIL